MATKFKTVKRYLVRYETGVGCSSKTVGRKTQLLERARAQRVIRRLRKSGVDAYLSSPLELKLAA